MKGFKAALLLLATNMGISSSHVVNVQEHQHQHDESRALAAVNAPYEFDLLSRRLDPVGWTPGGNCCGMCTQVTFSNVIILLLVSISNSNAGLLNPASLVNLGSVAVDIVVRITLVYTALDDNGDDGEEEELEFQATVTPQDWTTPPCSYLQDDCIVFENDEVVLYAPDAPGEEGILTIAALEEFTANSKVKVWSESCDLRCAESSDCSAFETEGIIDAETAGMIDLDSHGPGTGFGTVVQSTFNNGFCNPSIFPVIRSYSYSYTFL